MSFRSGRPTKRFIIIFGVILVVIFLSSLQVKTTSKAMTGTLATDDDTGSLSFEYNRPPDHGQVRLDGQLELILPPTHVTDTYTPDLSLTHKQQSVDTPSYASTIQGINQKYCGADQCRFMLPIAITEQGKVHYIVIEAAANLDAAIPYCLESKAQYHFRQLAFLSGKLNRTIVLPNVHSSHLGACRQHPFDFYYDHTWMDTNQAHFKYITMQQFRAWIQERQAVAAVPSGQEIFIEIDETFPHLSKANNCFKDLFDFTHRPRTRFQLEDPEMESRRTSNFTEIFLDVLGDAARAKEYKDQLVANDNDDDATTTTVVPDLEVIHLFYDRRFGYIEEPAVETPLAYHSRWTALADRIAAQLYPFVAIHWRMERLEPLSNLQTCAETLVRKLKQGTTAANVFLLTDYPHLLDSPLAKPESMSFKMNELRTEHHAAIRYLYEHTDVTLTTLQRQDIPYSDMPDQWHLIPVEAMSKPADKSILGIVDKLVAMRAQWFLYGQPAVCGKESSFTRRIRDERMAAYRSGDSTIVSPVDVFGLS